MVSLATDIRPPRGGGQDPLLRLAMEAGAQAIHLGAGADLGAIEPLVIAATRLGLEIASVGLPLGERPLGAGRRLPRLGAADRDERAAAIALAERGLAAGAAGGARSGLLDFGPVDLRASAPALVRAFARRELGDDETGGELLGAALDERRARGPAVLDACRFALEALLRIAEGVGVRLVLPVGATPWEAPSPREAGALMELFAGAPLGAAWNPGRLSVLCALGLTISDERLRSLAEGAALAVENDAVGLAAGLLPGLGERAPRIAPLAPPAAAPVVILGGPDATDEEVIAAVASIAGR